MRLFTFLLLSTCLVSTASAQSNPLMPPGANNAPAAGAGAPAATVATPGGVVNGKFQVGYEGRGDYLKNAEMEKQLAHPERHAAKAGKEGTSPATATAATVTPASSDAETPAPAAPRIRSDAALRSDSSKSRQQNAPAVKAQAAPVQAQPAPVAAYKPMVYVGGKLQQ